jgi:hypothetical protein
MYTAFIADAVLPSRGGEMRLTHAAKTSQESGALLAISSLIYPLGARRTLNERIHQSDLNEPIIKKIKYFVGWVVSTFQ